MKKDKLKELFEANEITHSQLSKSTIGGTHVTNENVHTNGSCTLGDVGCCDSDNTSATDSVGPNGSMSSAIDTPSEID